MDIDKEKWKKFAGDDQQYSVDCGERHLIIKKKFTGEEIEKFTVSYPSPTINYLGKKDD